MGCLITLAFWYAYVVWLFFFFMILSVETTTHRASFVAGVALSLARLVWEHRGTQEALWAFSRLTDWFRVLPRPSWKRQKSTEPPEQTASRAQEDRASFDREEAIRREQEAREAEARARRAQAEEEAKATAGQGMASSPDDQRTHEEVLGLKSPGHRTTSKRRIGERHNAYTLTNGSENLSRYGKQWKQNTKSSGSVPIPQSLNNGQIRAVIQP